MINFACKTVSIEDLIRCSFGINKTEYKVLIYLIDVDASLTAQEIAKNLKLDRTTVQKSVKKLYEKDIINKHQINYTKGGYSFIYSVKSKDEIKEKINRIIDDWSNSVKDYINNW